jgi:hypothetical protein
MANGFGVSTVIILKCKKTKLVSGNARITIAELALN